MVVSGEDRRGRLGACMGEKIHRVQKTGSNVFSARASTNDEFTVRVTDKPEDVKALLEVGFDYVCQKDNLIFMRKRK